MYKRTKHITVVGSINMDFVSACDKFPDCGETVFGSDFLANPGGKGANQAVAIARLGGVVKFIGGVGDDAIGCQLLENMQCHNISIDNVLRCVNVCSGVAQISVNRHGDNKIIVVPGANNLVDKQCIDNAIEIIENSSMIVCQHEIPLATIEYVSKQAVRFNVPMILNPAPAYKLSEQIIKSIEILILNENEASILTGIDVTGSDSGFKACEQLFMKGIKNIVLTMGAMGSLFYNENQRKHIPSLKVDVVDTTAAGDTFTGALAWYIVNRKSDLIHAVEFATKAAAISVMKKGAQISMPSLAQVESFTGALC